MASNKDTKNRKLQYLRDLSDYKMAKGDPDVRGWNVHDAEGDRIGEITGLLIDPVRERVVYIDVDVRDELISKDHDPFDAQHESGIHEYQDKKGDIHMIIPVGAAHVDRDKKYVVADGIDQGALKNYPSYRHRKDVPIHPDYERKVRERNKKHYVETNDGRLIDRDLSDDEYYNSEDYDQDRFYGRGKTKKG